LVEVGILCVCVRNIWTHRQVTVKFKNNHRIAHSAFGKLMMCKETDSVAVEPCAYRPRFSKNGEIVTAKSAVVLRRQ